MMKRREVGATATSADLCQCSNETEKVAVSFKAYARRYLASLLELNIALTYRELNREGFWPHGPVAPDRK